MKILGIDYGSKRVGIAIASTEAGMAFPKCVLPNDRHLIKTIMDMCKSEGVSDIVLGESKNLDGSDNGITESSRAFKSELEEVFGKTIAFVPEFYTTYEASRIQGDSDMIDASAAAIILQSYLDKLKN